MRVYPEQLADQLKGGLKPCYLLFGDEPLLKLEALGQIRDAARAQGFTERLAFATEENFDWAPLFDACQSLSLFASRQLIELELGAKLPRDWATQIGQLQARLHPDLLLVLHGPRLSQAQTKSKWFDNLSRQGTYVPISAPDGRHFPRWMENRCQRAGLKVLPEGLAFLCHAFEGNLLGAVQAIDKLLLLGLPQPLNAKQLQDNLTRHNHFTPFQLIDTLLAGKVNRAQRMLFQLREEGVEAGMLSWALAKELEQLLTLRLAQERGRPLGPLMEQARIWQSRQALVQQALSRLSSTKLIQLLELASRLDISLRAFDQDQAWLWLQSLCLGFRDPQPLEFLPA